ncbi:helix-turn-helix domain-containing protein [Nocardia higoensis]|uniref:helix-turn-helix domain-containing protein n=1 Tax=Nocardia higoensis TaxID=228599 RepID=UPI0002DEFB92|nr:helix-turn-helix domain-containing protein [Nocardia higoensis]
MSFTAEQTEGEEKTKSVVKALLLMDAFQDSTEPLGLTTIARRSGLPKSTTHRFLHYLESVGFVERVDGKYCVGRKVQLLGRVRPPARTRHAPQ